MKEKEKKSDRYELDKLTPSDLALIMDSINDYTIKYYTLNDLDKATFHTLSSLIERKYKKLHNVHVELALNIMESEGNIQRISDGPDEIFSHTEKGLVIFFNGGFQKEIAKKKREKLLILLGQIGIITAGIYYLIEILKTILPIIMKIKLFFFMIILLSGTLNAQNLNKNQLSNIIDSLENIIEENNKKIDALNKNNLEIKNELNKYKSQLNDSILENVDGDVYVCDMGTVIYDKPGGYKSLSRLINGDRVKVLSSVDKYYYVFFNGIYGYARKSAFISEAQSKHEEQQRMLKEQRMTEINLKIKLAKEERERERKKVLINKYGQTVGTKIFEGRIWLGMTEKMIIDSRGKPEDINRDVGSWGVHEQWIYGDKYLYIENGKLTSWQD